MQLKNVTLETTLKPFKQNGERSVRETAHEIFFQWLALLRHADTVSVMLWVGEGSEILDYSGDLDDRLEWACYMGLPNPIHKGVDPNDPEGISLDRRYHDYMPNPPERDYRWLKDLVTILKEVGEDVTGKPIRVGATLDPGPEFARSPFKYERHPEILEAAPPHKSGIYIHVNTKLHADQKRYAGYPQGIPEGTPIGTFIGRQSQRFMADLNFDYIWFSNALGFGLETWGGSGVFCVGSVFDGKTFHPERCGRVREEILDFWRQFRAECPDFPVETRGSNLPTSLTLGADAVPSREIYRGDFNMVPPPNSPWAALDGDFGIELVGWMSRIAELPGEDYPFRFYTHDPWWMASPWIHQYAREPHDIYLPLSVSRLDGHGEAHTASSVSFITIDDSYGDMPDCVPNEVIPHVLEAKRTAPDRPGPLLWVYPFDEYHDMTFAGTERIGEILFGDLFVRGALNHGFPLNTVISTGNFVTAAADSRRFLDTVVVIPVICLEGKVWEALRGHLEAGGRVVAYGPVDHACQDVLAALNLKHAAPLEGDMELELNVPGDPLTGDAYPGVVRHDARVCGGGIEAVLGDAADPHCRVVAMACQGNEKRVAALWRGLPEWGGGRLAWVRGTSSFGLSRTNQPEPFDSALVWHAEILMRYVLAELGFEVLFGKCRPDQRSPILAVSRHRNAFVFSGFLPDLLVDQHFRLPQGAPLFPGLETRLVSGRTTYRMHKAWRRKCRAFVTQDEDSELTCYNRRSRFVGITRRQLITGLKNATVRFYHDIGTEENLTMLRNPHRGDIVGEKVEFSVQDDSLGVYLLARNVSGQLLISW